MSGSTPWTDILSIFIALGALALSALTFYLTKLKQFRGYVIPTRRITLTWIEKRAESGASTPSTKPNDLEPGLLLECEFINQGARPGKIEDVLIQLQHAGSGDKMSFLAYLMGEFTGVLAEENQPLRDFSTLWIPPNSTLHTVIVFKPARELNLSPGRYKLRLGYSGDNVQTKTSSGRWLTWAYSDVVFDFEISDDHIKAWKRYQTVRLESVNLQENRKQFFDSSL
jgi:hypothetical protein